MADVRQSYWRTTDIEAGIEAVVDVDVDAHADTDTEAGTPEAGTPEAAVPEAAVPEDVTQEEAEEAWAPEAHRILARVAKTYQGLIEYAELAAEIQESSGIHTRRQVRSWIAPVLTQVAHLNHDRDEPPLTALVVHKADGTVGVGYDEALQLAGDPELADPIAREKHAAKARLACYHWAGANVPADGGRPALSPRFEQIQARQRKERRALETSPICSVCFMAIPPTGVCDNCG